MATLKLLETVIASLTLRPEDWEYTGYEVTNKKKKTTIWVANGLTWLEITVEGRRVLGGFNCIPVTPWRWRLWSAARKIMRKGSTEDREVSDLVAKHWFAQV